MNLEPPKDRKCPTCRLDLEIKQNQFFWRGTFFTGLVCSNKHSCWDNPDDSFMKHVAETADDPPDVFEVIHENGETYVKCFYNGYDYSMFIGVIVSEENIKKDFYSHVDWGKKNWIPKSKGGENGER